MIRISVIIPTFNRLADLTMVLDALEAQTRRDFEVIVVDNGSEDGTEPTMTARAAGPGTYPLRYLRISPSGPAGARNAGIAQARGDCLAFVDSDVELEPDWLALCMAELDADPELAGVGGVVIYANDRGHVNAYGGVLSRLGLAWDAREGQPVASVTMPEDRLWINCSAFLVRAAQVRRAGGFDGRFFYGFEDSDLGWRISAAGGRQRVIPQARCYHHVGDSIGEAADPLIYHGCKNRLASLITNAGPAMLAVYLPLYLGYALADALLRGRSRPKLRALAWNIRNLPGTLARRRQLNAMRRRSDRELASLYAPRLFPKTRLGGLRRRPNRAQDLDGTRDDRIAK